MKLKYIPKNVELFIQNLWIKKKIFQIQNIKTKKYYCLSMFPYPSGKLHIGHVRNYTIGDIISGYKRLKQYTVLNPIGWDSFGMPAENAANKKNVHPKLWTYDNIKNMKKQLKLLGFSFDWSREITTSKPNYYKWEQLFFIKLYKSNLIYKKKTFVNWDPVDKTVLANEQVVNGRGWRSNVVIKRKKINQWYLKITAYANELLNDLNILKNWPDKVKSMQVNWINKNIKYVIKLNIINSNIIFYITYKNVSDLNNINYIIFFKEYDHWTVIHNSYNKQLYIVNPVNNNKIFIFTSKSENKYNKKCYKEGRSDNLICKKKHEVIKHLKCNVIKYIYLRKLIFNKLKKKATFDLQDWCISRQRYWGTPIPIIYCIKCGVLPESERCMPIILPYIKNYNNRLLKSINCFNSTYCSKCNFIAYRETDTFDTFFESSWYYIKYLCKKNINKDILNLWLPVDQYIGGIEHATMHLIYARFFHKLMKDFNIITSFEPFSVLLTQGMVLMNGFKMSKSKGNIANQEKLIYKYGADTLRLFIIFAAPAEQSFEWNENGINGCKKFLAKIWQIAYNLRDIKLSKDNINFNYSIKEQKIILAYNNILFKINLILDKSYSFNVIVALLMSMLKIIDQIIIISDASKYLYRILSQSLIILLSPITPHVTNFIWTVVLKKKIYIINEFFPLKIYNKNNINIFELMILINNKFKIKIKINQEFNIKMMDQYILNNSVIKKTINNKKIKNIIYIKNKIINIIV